jgi:hypothetical protein
MRGFKFNGVFQAITDYPIHADMREPDKGQLDTP